VKLTTLRLCASFSDRAKFPVSSKFTENKTENQQKSLRETFCELLIHGSAAWKVLLQLKKKNLYRYSDQRIHLKKKFNLVRISKRVNKLFNSQPLLFFFEIQLWSLLLLILIVNFPGEVVSIYLIKSTLEAIK